MAIAGEEGTGHLDGRVGRRVSLISRADGTAPTLTSSGLARGFLACADDNNGGQSLAVLGECERDRQILDEERWSDHMSEWSNRDRCAEGHTYPALLFSSDFWRELRTRKGQHMFHWCKLTVVENTSTRQEILNA